MTISQLQTYLLSGFVYSIGSLTESFIKSANQSFLQFNSWVSQAMSLATRLCMIIEKLLNLCRTHLKNDRLSSSLIKTIDLIVQNGFLNDDKYKSIVLSFEFVLWKCARHQRYAKATCICGLLLWHATIWKQRQRGQRESSSRASDDSIDDNVVSSVSSCEKDHGVKAIRVYHVLSGHFRQRRRQWRVRDSVSQYCVGRACF